MVQTLVLNLFDLLLCYTLLVLAWIIITSKNLFKAVVLFISFGLLISLIWVRLNAPDVALAEAAVGAGVTGALLLVALSRLDDKINYESITTKFTVGFVSCLTVAVAIFILAVSMNIPVVSDVMQTALNNKMPESGVSNPVTAVLLNFRGYDTMLELIVLFAAALSVWSLGPSLALPKIPINETLSLATQILIPIIIIVSIYLLWIGSSKPGGAFQGGAVLAAAGLLWLMSGQPLRILHKPWQWRLVLVLGPLTFVLASILLLLQNGLLLQFSSTSAATWILFIESAALLSVASIMIILFLGGRPIIDQNKDAHK